MRIQDGPIIPGVGIGNIQLNISKKELINIIGNSYKEQKLGIGYKFDIENASFWLGEDNCVYQIGVRGEFNGKFKEVIGIGSTFRDVKKYVGNYTYEYYTYNLDGIKGICFELEQPCDLDEEWDELTAPIEWIFVFRC